ncbi:MAG: hypothetical protein U9P14_10620 [Gemmatimonadota bacterium]|nr:hypothetical protein [Gemmatimonadota bacterium]
MEVYKKYRLFLVVALGVGTILLLYAGCSSSRKKESGPAGNPALTVARGAKTVAVKTARAGALLSKLIATNTWRGSRRAVTWTGSHTASGTTATLERLGLKERPAPPDLLERLPDHLLESLRSLEFISPLGAAGKRVLSSPDVRWEGEIFHRLGRGNIIEADLTGPVELIVVTLACFSPGWPNNRGPGNVTYTVYVREDMQELGQVSFEAAASDIIYLHGYTGWRAGGPGVFVVQVPEGRHRYRFTFDREDESTDPLLVCFFIPHYD